MALKDRVERAKAAAQFAKVTGHASSHTYLAEVPGHEGRTYKVAIHPAYSDCGETVRGYSRVTCVQHSPKQENCKGNSNGYICYHALAAILAIAKGKANVAFCNTWEDAELLSRTGGRVVEFSSTQGRGFVWAVVREVK